MSPSTISSDEDTLTTPINKLTEEEYFRMLKEHKRKRRMKIVSALVFYIIAKTAGMNLDKML